MAHDTEGTDDLRQIYALLGDAVEASRKAAAKASTLCDDELLRIATRAVENNERAQMSVVKRAQSLGMDIS